MNWVRVICAMIGLFIGVHVVSPTFVGIAQDEAVESIAQPPDPQPEAESQPTTPMRPEEKIAESPALHERIDVSTTMREMAADYQAKLNLSPEQANKIAGISIVHIQRIDAHVRDRLLTFRKEILRETELLARESIVSPWVDRVTFFVLGAIIVGAIMFLIGKTR